MNKVLFDNNCLFCNSIKNILYALDMFKIFLWIPSSQLIENESNQLITKEMIESSIVLIKKNNDVLTEFKACKYIVSRIPFFYPILIFFYIPFFSNYFGNKIYRIIALRRKCNA